jgi:hypothetical protein
MSTPSTTTVVPPTAASSTAEVPAWKSALYSWIRQRDRVWLLLILLILAALFLGGCHARSQCCHSPCQSGSAAGDTVLATFYVAYVLGWIIVTAAGG